MHPGHNDGRPTRSQNCRVMSDRFSKALTARLEELACVLERSGADAPSVARLLEAASIATMNAVALDLLTEQTAKSIWAEVAVLHPRVAEELRAAA